ncbi:MAG: malto-oligosyltrehalose trehalohydrolase, partial [Janthinobacterium lividum]
MSTSNDTSTVDAVNQAGNAGNTLNFGARLLADNQTVFTLWAPATAGVAVELPNREPVPMTALDGPRHGWYEATVDCGVGTLYRYQVSCEDGSVLTVPDPASRAQDGDVHDCSMVVDPHSYEWKNNDWRGRPWHETVLYELHAGALGGFKGVAERLPALAALGFTAIELMPIADFPGPRNWGYDGVLQFAPDSTYGTPDELKAMIDTAHGLGLMVFLDVVYNHFGPDGNYIGVYAPPFFRDDIDTPWGKAIDFRRQEVRDFFTINAMYWLNEFRFDGLRFDAVHAITEQDWLPEVAQRVRAAVEPGRHVHLTLEHDENVVSFLERKGEETVEKCFDAQWNDDGHHILHVMLTGEQQGYYQDYADNQVERLARCLGEGFVYQGDPAVTRNGALRGHNSKHLPPTAFVLFLQNHDQIGNRAFGERLTQLTPPLALRAASALLLLSPMIPMLFMGEESGATEPFMYFTSYPQEELAVAVRDGRRQAFAEVPAFATEAQQAMIADPNLEEPFDISIPDFETTNVWQTWTSRLLKLRHEHIIPRLHGAMSIGAKPIGPKAVAARWRMGDGAILTLMINLSFDSVPIDAMEYGAREHI